VLTLPGVKDENAINHIKNNSYLDFQAPVQEDGKFELYLPPGNFMVREFGDNSDKYAVPITIHDPKTDKDAKHAYRADLVYPASLRGKFAKEDGTAKKHCLTCRDGNNALHFDFDTYWKNIEHKDDP
jgi:hypothetical protein